MLDPAVAPLALMDARVDLIDLPGIDAVGDDGEPESEAVGRDLGGQAEEPAEQSNTDTVGQPVNDADIWEERRKEQHHFRQTVLRWCERGEVDADPAMVYIIIRFHSELLGELHFASGDEWERMQRIVALDRLSNVLGGESSELPPDREYRMPRPFECLAELSNQ